MAPFAHYIYLARDSLHPSPIHISHVTHRTLRRYLSLRYNKLEPWQKNEAFFFPTNIQYVKSSHAKLISVISLFV